MKRKVLDDHLAGCAWLSFLFLSLVWPVGQILGAAVTPTQAPPVNVTVTATLLPNVTEDVQTSLTLKPSFIASNVIKVDWATVDVILDTASKMLVTLSEGHQNCSGPTSVSRTVHVLDGSTTFWDVSENVGEFTTCGTLLPANQKASSQWFQGIVIRQYRLPPVVTLGPDSLLPDRAVYYIPYGNKLDIPCQATGYPTPSVSFFKDGLLIEENATPRPGIYSVSDRKDIEGVYYCVATNEYGVARSGNLTVIKPYLGNTDVSSFYETRQVTERTDLTLRCHFLESRPAALIEWNKDFESVELDDRVMQTEDGELIFTSTAMEDSGEYTCHLYNSYLMSGRDTRVYKVDVRPGDDIEQKLKPKRLHPTKARQELYPLQGFDLIIHCVFSGSSQTIWRYNDLPLPHKRLERYHLSPANQTMTIRGVREKDRGEFQCEGKNKYGAEKGTIFKISPQASPTWISLPLSQNVSEGETVAFTCEAKGIPQPKITWYIDGKMLGESVAKDYGVHVYDDDSKLVLNGVSKNSSCTVQCHAQNDHGAVWADAYMNVCDRLHITREPEDIEVTKDDDDTFNFRFNCEATADPTQPLHIMWMKNDEIIPDEESFHIDQEDKSLVIKASAENVDSYNGTYACVAHDGVSNVTKEARLVIRRRDTRDSTKQHATSEQVLETHPVISTDTFFLKENLWIVLIVIVTVGVVFAVVIIAISARCRKKTTAPPVRQASPALMHLLPAEDNDDIDTLPSLAKLDSELKRKVREVHMPHSRLKLGELIGKGEFGRVHVAMLRNEEDCKVIPEKVAVKTLKYKPDETEMVGRFLREAVTMKGFEHEHILGLIGITFDIDSSPMVILPYMANGDLRKYVQNPSLDITVLELLFMGLQVARGMVYLSSKRTIHRDLAARNCMVDAENKVKVADFGLSRELLNTDYYQVDHFGGNPLPLRWMAPESLEMGVFTTQSDVWSYGVLLWELMTRGEIPYEQINNQDVADHIRRGGNLSQPPFCPDSVFRIMGQCWEAEPSRRPNFSNLVSTIEQIVTRARSGSLSTTRTFYVNIGIIARNRRQQMSSLSSWSETDAEVDTSLSSV